MADPRIERIIALLAREYGYPRFEPDRDRAFRSLRASFPRWENIAEAEIDRIASAIRVGGLAEIKARRIKQALNEIRQERGALELDFLARLPLDEAKAWLKRLPGVGSKTAGCVLLFSFGMPALPVDTHILRVSKRLGLVEAKASAEQAHLVLEDLAPLKSVYQFHVLMIEHGRKTCRAQRPWCLRCVLGEICPSYEIFTGSLAQWQEPSTGGGGGVPGRRSGRSKRLSPVRRQAQFR